MKKSNAACQLEELSGYFMQGLADPYIYMKRGSGSDQETCMKKEASGSDYTPCSRLLL